MNRLMLGRQQWQLVILGVVIAVGWLYWPTLDYGLVWDDVAFIEIWQTVRNLPENWQVLLAGEVPLGHEGAYRPLRSFLYGASWWGWRGEPRGYHLQAVVGHVLVSVLVGWLVEKLTKDKLAGLMSGWAFGWHPAAVETVAWVTASFDALAVIPLLAAVILWVDYKHGWSKKLAIILVWVAVFTSELALMAPALVMMVDLAKPKQKRSGGKTYAGLWLPFGVYWLVRLGLELPDGHGWLLGDPAVAVVVMPLFLIGYLKLWWWPVTLSVNHWLRPGLTGFYWLDFNYAAPAPRPRFSDGDVWLSWLGLLVLIGFMVWNWRKNRTVVVGPVWWLVGLVPVLPVISFGVVFAERFSYLAGIGWVIWLGYLVASMRKKGLVWGLIGVGLMIGWWGWLTRTRLPVWQSEGSLWKAAVTERPESAKVNLFLGLSLLREGKKGQGEQYLARAVKINPNNEDNLKVYGGFLAGEKRWSEAREVYEKLTQIRPGEPMYVRQLEWVEAQDKLGTAEEF